MGPRLKLRLEFEGTPFCGWQLQSPEAESRQSSIQGALEAAFSVVLHKPGVRYVVQGCSRTDAGVHAEEFFAHADLADDDAAARDLERFRHALNSVLPPAVVLTSLTAAPGFHALNDATAKVYEYRMLLRRAKPVLLASRALWLPLEPFKAEYFDLDSIERALGALRGEHDFVAFAAANIAVKTTVRKLLRCELESKPLFADPSSGQLVTLRFEGTGFLKQMVRNLAGTLIEVGQRRRSVESVAKLLSAPGQRQDAGHCAGPEGLHLTRVRYDD